MTWKLPGTVLRCERSEADDLCRQFNSLFLAGGLTLSQITSITGLEAHTVQNWVKRGFLSPPKNKRYSLEQLCRIITINMLRGGLPLEKVCSLTMYVNGSLTDDSDDLIDDAQLYFLFVRLASRARHMSEEMAWEKSMEEALAEYHEPVPGATERVTRVLRIMLLVWAGNCMLELAGEGLAQLQT